MSLHDGWQNLECTGQACTLKALQSAMVASGRGRLTQSANKAKAASTGLSADSILFALHRSYDNTLKQMEVLNLIPGLQRVLNGMRKRLKSTTSWRTWALLK